MEQPDALEDPFLGKKETANCLAEEEEEEPQEGLLEEG